MKTYFLKFVLLAVSLMSLNVNAITVNSFTCPQSYRTVQVGDTMDAVRTACGNPTSINNSNVPVTTPVNVSQWIYTANLKVKDSFFSTPFLIITLENNVVTQIERTSFVGPVSNYCGTTGIINVGDSDTSVISACGRPNIVNNKQRASTVTKQTTQWVYNFGPYRPQATFIFEGNNLTSISSGN